MGSDFFSLSEICTQLTFSIGAHSLSNLRLIELHFFQNQIIHKVDFSFPFCPSDTVNTWENIYAVPKVAKILFEGRGWVFLLAKEMQE